MLSIMYRVIHEDEYLIGIDKLSPMPCIRQGDSAALSDEVIMEYPFLSSIRDNGFTHRLDNDTLGVLLIARTASYYEKMRELFNNKGVNKIYHARVNGVMVEDHGVIDLPIAHSSKSAKKMVVVRPGYRIYRGKPRDAVTEWTVMKKKADSTDLELRTRTGVRHQIRVHLHSIGVPICGDVLYSDHSSGHPSMMLISKRVFFKCPVRGSDIEVISKLDLDNMFDVIR